MSNETLITQFFVAGLIFCDYADAKLKRGQRLSLVKEPTNVHDSRAIQVFTTGKRKTHIGYVPRELTYQLHGFKGKVTRAVIRAYAPTNATHRMVLVNVYGMQAKPEVVNTIC